MALVRRSGTWLACGLCLVACSDRTRTLEPFTIAHTSPALDAASAPLLLNDSITVYFSADVLPVSVTGNSVTLVDEQGQAVPGSLRVGSNWVTFQPVPPVSAELTDGSYRPGASYRLLVAGSPRPDAVRAADGRRLAAATTFPVRIAVANDRPPGLPAPLRPAGNDIPFFLRAPDGLQQLPADAPRLLLHFTQPLLPSSVTPAAFEITLIDRLPGERIVPRHVRVLPPRLQVPRPDEPLGSTVEIDLGALPERASGAPPEALPHGKFVGVQLRLGAGSVRDYAGQAPLPRDSLLWSVVAGSSLPLAEWGSPRDVIAADDGLSPTFEVHPDGMRPRVRVEAGDGSLGVFRPRVDTTLRPGQAFDRGDGELVVSRGSEFSFLAIDIPANVTVRVEADDVPVQLLACGSARIAGTLLVVATPQRLPAGRSSTLPVRDLAAQVPAAIVAAGDIELRGRVLVAVAATGDKTNLLLATAGAIDLRGLAGELPFQTMLAVDADTQGGGGAIRGPRSQSTLYLASFTYGVATGGDFTVTGTLPWQQLPADRDGGVVHFDEAGSDIQFAWQSAPADPVRKNEPDLAVGRCSRLQPAVDQDTLAVTAGAFVRFTLTARVQGGVEPPRVRAVRLCDR